MIELANQEDLYEAAELSDRLRIHEKENKLLYYQPCCKIHFDKEKRVMTCPKTPCPDSKHWAFHMSNKRIRPIFGGNRSSKTTTGITELLMQSVLKRHPYRKTVNPYPGRWRIYESDFGVIEKLILPKVRDLIPIQALRSEGPTKEAAWAKSYDPKFHILNLKGGGMIDFMSYDQEISKSASLDLDGIYADEEMPEAMYTEAMARLVSRRGFFIIGVTPLYSLTWAMKFLESFDPQVECFHFEIYDNPFIDEKDIKEFEDSIPDHEKSARIKGQFLELQGLVYNNLRSDIHLIGEETPTPDSPIIFSLDPHPRKASVMTWSFVNGKGDVIFFDELELKGNARDIASAIRYKESKHKARTLLRLIDPAAKAQGNDLSFETDTLAEFQREGLDFDLADNSEAGYGIVQEYISYDKTQPLSSFNRPRVFFTKNVPKTWYGMTHLLWDEWNSRKTLRDKKERVKDYLKDFPDCVRYTLAVRPTARSFYNIRPVMTKRATGYGPDFNRHQEFRQMALGKR